jgi:hypothetical protein
MPDEFRRRTLLELASVALVGACSKVDLGLADGDSFDTVLDRLHAYDPIFDGGLSNHAPMAADALVALGRDDRVVDFVNGYASNLEELVTAPALAADQRAASLGNEQRGAWIASYEDELATELPRDVLSRDWAMLCPGYAAEGYHGLLRVAHAVRSLEREDTPSRRRELAHGMGFLGAHYRALPGLPGSRPVAGKDVLQALGEVQIVPGAPKSGYIIDRLVAVEGDASFVDVVETVDLAAWPVDAALGELVAAAARLFVANGGDSFAYLHGVTGTSALRLILPWLDAPAQELGLGYAFQTLAALHATQGTSAGVPISVSSTAADPQSLSATAADSSDEHKIKLVEAALREHALAPRAELLAAADVW